MSNRRVAAAIARVRPVLVWLAIGVAAGQPAAAQTLTGTLSGTVKDEQGGVLAGAVVRLTSPALMTGTLQTTSSDKGQWRFPVLPIGDYVLTVELPPRFAPYRESAIQVGPGAILERQVALALAGITQTVTVEATPAGTQGSGLETRRDSEYISSIPSRRFSMFDLFRGVPGVSPSSPSSATVNTLTVFGSAVNENLFLIDGTNFTCPCQGVSRSEPGIDVIQAVQVQTTGASVEYGNAQGGVFNVVTKQGGARYAYDASYYGQPASLTAQPVRLAAPLLGGTQTGFERITYRDLTTNLGGPIKRDRVWFFAGYQYIRDYDSQPGADPAQPRTYEQNKGFGKVTWRLTPSLQVMHSVHYEAWVNPQVPTSTVPFIATTRTSATVPAMTFANITHTLSNSTVWEARVGRFIVNQNMDPSSGDRLTPPHIDSATNVASSGNAAQIGTVRFDRVTGKAVLHHFEQDWLGVGHQFRFGTQIERGQHRATQAFPGGVQYRDANGLPSQKIERNAWTLGGRFNSIALFASDSVAVNDRITAEIGLRYDYSHAISQDLGGVDAGGRPADGFTPGLGSLYRWNVFSPRLGLTWRLAADGRTVARANYSRFSQGVLTGELDPVHPGVSVVTTTRWNPVTQDYSIPVSVVDPNSNITLDANTRAPHTDEYSVAIDHQIRPGLRASVAYIAKRGRDSIGWHDIGGKYADSTTTLADGTILPVHVLTSTTAERLFELTNTSNLFLKYDGFVVAMEKRLSRGWQASGSYTFSRTYGQQVTSNSVVTEGQFSTVARPATLTFGQDPNDLTNATGRLLNDRPHIFRATGLVQMRWGILVAANLQHFSGKPWMAVAQVALPQSPTQRIMIEPRGTRRLSSQSLLDLRVSKMLRLGTAGTVDLRVDLLNLLNDTAEEGLATDVLFNAAGVRQSAFGTANVFMDPRRVMLSVRLNLGS